MYVHTFYNIPLCGYGNVSKMIRIAVSINTGCGFSNMLLLCCTVHVLYMYVNCTCIFLEDLHIQCMYSETNQLDGNRIHVTFMLSVL